MGTTLLHSIGMDGKGFKELQPRGGSPPCMRGAKEMPPVQQSSGTGAAAALLSARTWSLVLDRS